MARKTRLPYLKRELYARGPQRTFGAEDGVQIAMPLGGIGAGCICLNGYGGVQDFSIRNRPGNSQLPDTHGSRDGAFALLHVKGRKLVTRLVEGPLPREKVYNFGLQGNGARGAGYHGLPRFEKCSFKGEYPFGTVKLSDPAVPLRVTVTGWSPLIPLDDRSSGLPCAILEYELKNPTRRRQEFTFSYHMSDLAGGGPKVKRGTHNTPIANAGVFFRNGEAPASDGFGSAAFAMLGQRAKVKAAWFRGGWFDAISALWREVSTDTFKTDDGRNASGGGSAMISGSLGPGESMTVPVVIAWHFPNIRDAACGSVGGCCDDDKAKVWHPYYASQWADAREVIGHVRDHYGELRSGTQAFHDALFGSTLPAHVLDAVSANLGIMKSPTVLRDADTGLWAWEGCHCESGCCSGSCTHVWNYAQAFPHLFPALERTFRERELMESMNRAGHVTFRNPQPGGKVGHGFHAAADGQLGGILKVYREWQISGDRAWLKRMYKRTKRSLDYCIGAWDPRGRGVLEEPHHNTYDIEFWGPDGMCSSIYIGALCAMAEIERELGHDDQAGRYAALAKKGAAALDGKLFNGDYYIQKTTTRGLRDTSFTKQMAKVNAKSSAEDKLLKREGPKYQYGTGCLSDGVIGAWMAALYGVKTPLRRANVRKHLRSIFKQNFRADLWEHANPQRPGYALGHEAGLLLCSWPRGGKPTLPFPYSDEVWTGFEYQVASHMIAEGLVDEALCIVKAARDRYDGKTRNPWNEYECGSYYARAMSSYALLTELAGFRYSAATHTLWFDPKIDAGDFRTFFSTATGWGVLRQKVSRGKGTLTIDLRRGELILKRIVTPLADREEVLFDEPMVAQPGRPLRLTLK
jgi:uncharacterized protein (DUF608 family)